MNTKKIRRILETTDRNNKTLWAVRDAIVDIQDFTKSIARGEKIDLSTLIDLTNQLTESYREYITAHSTFLKEVVLY